MADLQFQKFDLAASGSGGPPPSRQQSQQQQQQQQSSSIGVGSAPEQNETGKHSIWSFQYWTPYFNVDSHQVLPLPLLSLPLFFWRIPATIENNPDLWGPFWIPTTLVVVLFISNSLASAIAAHSNNDKYHYDFNKLTAAAFVICLYGTILPVVVWLACRKWKIGLSLVDLFSIYGYSWSLWIPVAIVCVVPIPLLRWVMIALACSISAAFIFKNIVPLISKQTEKKKAGIASLFIVGAHIGLALLYKFMFFG